MTAHQNLQEEMSRLLSQEKPSESLSGISSAFLTSVGSRRQFGDVMQERDQAFSSGIDKQIGRKIQVAELMIRQATLDQSRGGKQGADYMTVWNGLGLDKYPPEAAEAVANVLGPLSENIESVSVMNSAATKVLAGFERTPKEFAPKGPRERKTETYEITDPNTGEKYQRTIDVNDPGKLKEVLALGGVKIAVSKATVGTPAEMAATTATQTDIQGKLVESAEMFSELDAMEAAFQAEFFTLPGRFKGEWSALKEILGSNLTPEEKKYLTEFTAMRAAGGQLLTKILHKFAGTAVTKIEENRVKSFAPDPGTGLFSGDSPTQFLSKMKNLRRALEAINIKLEYMAINGITANTLVSTPNRPEPHILDYEDMVPMIDAFAFNLKRQFKKDGFTDEEAIISLIKRRVTEKFGVPFDEEKLL